MNTISMDTIHVLSYMVHHESPNPLITDVDHNDISMLPSPLV